MKRNKTKYFLPFLLGSGCLINVVQAQNIQPTPLSSDVTTDKSSGSVNSTEYTNEARTLNQLLLANPRAVNSSVNTTVSVSKSYGEVEKPNEQEAVVHQLLANVQQAGIPPEIEATNDVNGVKPLTDRVTYPLAIDNRDQSYNFLGFIFYAGAGFNWNKIDVDVNNSGSTHESKNRVSPLLGFEYGARITDKIVLTLGMNYLLSDVKFDYITNSSNGILGGTSNVSVKIRNRLAFYVAPGYKIRPDWMVYGKVGYHFAKGEYTNHMVLTTGVISDKGSDAFNGIGIGVGVSYAPSPNIINSLELNHVTYDQNHTYFTRGKYKSTEITASVKYRF